MPGPGSYNLNQTSIQNRLNSAQAGKRNTNNKLKSKTANGRSRNVEPNDEMTLTAGFLHSKIKNIERASANVLENELLNKYSGNDLKSQTKTVGPGDYYKEMSWLDRSQIIK